MSGKLQETVTMVMPAEANIVPNLLYSLTGHLLGYRGVKNGGLQQRAPGRSLCNSWTLLSTIELEAE